MGEESGLDRALVAKGWLTEGEREFLFASVRGMDEYNYVVNIGVEYGASVVCFAESAPEIGVAAIDIDMSKWPYGDSYSPAVYLMEDDSQSIVEVIFFTGRPNPYIDVLFVDGDHSYEGVQRDSKWASLVRSGGLVIFHDCYDWLTIPEKKVHQVCPGVNKAVDWWIRIYDQWWEEQPHVDTMRVFRRTE